MPESMIQLNDLVCRNVRFHEDDTVEWVELVSVDPEPTVVRFTGPMAVAVRPGGAYEFSLLRVPGRLD